MYLYDQKFYDYISRGSKRSAEQIVPFIKKHLPINSVLDVGCGAGAWLQIWKGNGSSVKGLDGDYVNRDFLFVESDEFEPADLSKGFNLSREFDLVQSLEVAEHLPASSAKNFVKCLCSHANFVLFSAAPPGQGGDNHVNEQPYEYWRQIFLDNGYECIDLIRSNFRTNKKVENWYKYNMFLYVNRDIFDGLPADVKAMKVTQPLVDGAPGLYRFRKWLIRILPTFIATKIAKVKETLFVWAFRFSR